MVSTETVEIRGHILDTGILSGALNAVLEYGGDYTVEKLDVGRKAVDESLARISVRADDDELLQRLLMRLQAQGANPVHVGEAALKPASRDGVFPPDFYSTTNLDTSVRLGGRWVEVANPEMDCGLVVTGTGPGGAPSVRTVPMSDVRAGDAVVCGTTGVRVVLAAPSREEGGDGFGFMASEVSSEKPQALVVRQIAERMRQVKAAGRKVLWVGGPAVVHTGAAPAMVALVEAGYVDVLFAGNALATHDIESSLYGTSLGIDLARGAGVEHGHEHHIRAINAVREAGSIAAAVDSGLLTGGVMHALVRAGAPYVLVGSVRDDGPLPDVITDVVEGQRAMRAQLPDVGFVIMVATLLHSVATGNMLPASVPLVCVDINPAAVTKLADRGSTQAQGVVTDIGLFLGQLAAELTTSAAEGGDGAGRG